MTQPTKTLTFIFERTIPATLGEVFDAWLDPQIPGTPWNMADKFLLNPTVDGFFYWRTSSGIPHYGRFTAVERPGRIQYTWVSPNTLGEESTVTVTFQQKGEDTLMTLVHAGIPDTDRGRGHEKGWNYFLDMFPAAFVNTSRSHR